MKKLIFIILGIVLLVLSFFSYKLFLLQKYHYIFNKEDNIILKFDDIINIKHISVSLNEQYKELSFNLPVGFIYNEENSNLNNIDGVGYNNYLLNYVDNQNYDAKIVVGTKVNLYNSLINGEVESFDLKGINVQKLFKKYGINNNQTLYEAIFNIHNNKINIFSNNNDIKYNYLIQTISDIIMPPAEYFQLTGDVEGYLLNYNNIYEAHIYSNNAQIVIGFWNIRKEVFNKKTIEQFLSEIIVKSS